MTGGSGRRAAGGSPAPSHCRVLCGEAGDGGASSIGGETTITVSDVIGRYTDPETGTVTREKAVEAVNDYLFNDILSREDAVTVVNAYLFG